MKILIVGFQRSGTTLLRRLFHLHPEVQRMFHEVFLLKTNSTHQKLNEFIKSKKLDINKPWGEKVPFYPSARRYPIIKYCNKWVEYFGDESRIIHIIRNPYDVAISNVKKFSHTKTVEQPLRIYKKIMIPATDAIASIKTATTIKYEDLLSNPDVVLSNLYEACQLTPDIDYKKSMSKIENPKYQTIDSSRLFSYKDSKTKFNVNMKEEIEYLNQFGISKYDLV